MDKDFNSALSLLSESKRILLTMHERMDGDDGAATTALALHLEHQAKHITHCIKGGVPKQLRFLPRSDKVVSELQDMNFDLILISGCSTKDRCGIPEVISNTVIPVINIDHHPDNTHFGTVNIVDPHKSSVAEIVYNLFIHAKWKITPQIATCLLTGIFTDTGSFMHSNTQASTLHAAGQLMRKGANTYTIAKHTYKGKTAQVLKAWGKALQNTHYDERKKMIYSVITDRDLQELGSLPQATFEGLVETLNKVPEAKYAVFIRQDGNVIKGSLRSDPAKGIDVSKIAKIFGGGGHRYASGFSVVGKLHKDKAGLWHVI